MGNLKQEGVVTTPPAKADEVSRFGDFTASLVRDAAKAAGVQIPADTDEETGPWVLRQKLQYLGDRAAYRILCDARDSGGAGMASRGAAAIEQLRGCWKEYL